MRKETKCNKFLSAMVVLLIFMSLFSGVVLSEGNANAISKQITRLAGDNRYETATKIALAAYHQADTVIIARGDILFDALGGSVLAGALDAPILLTRSEKLHAHTSDAIDTLGAKDVIILGGENAVSSVVVDELKSFGLNVKRVYGEDRYETAAAIAREVSEKLGANFGNKAFVVSGTAVPDALVIGPYAASNGIPILMVREDSVPETTTRVIDELDIKEMTVIGGTAVVNNTVQKSLKAFRVYGENRYETSVEVAKEYYDVPDQVIFASGQNANLVDAVAGSYFGAIHHAPILYNYKSNMHGVVKDYFKSIITENTNTFMLGGESTLSAAVAEEIYFTLVGVDDMVFDEAGTYGPETGTITIDDDVMVKADGVTLQNLVITGDLIIAEEVGDGDVTLNNLTVKGELFVRGGGQDSIHINKGQYKNIVVENIGDKVRIVAMGVIGYDGKPVDVVISEDATGKEIILEGEFDEVTVDAKGVTVNVRNGSKVSTMTLNTQANVTGQGTIGTANVNADSVTFEKAPVETNVASGVKGPGVSPPHWNPPSEPTIVQVSAISVKTALAKTTYIKDEALDLKGLVVTLEKTNSTTEDVAFANFVAKGISTSPANGATLTIANTAVIITHTASGKTATVAVTVNAPVEEPQPITGSFESTNNVGIAPESAGAAAGKIYAEYKLVADNKDISLAASNVEYIKVKVGEGDWTNLTADTDATLWFNVEAANGIRSYEVKTKDGDVYTATLDWNKVIKTATWTATGGEEIRPDTPDAYVEYKLMDGTNQVSLKAGVAKLFASKTEGKWKSHELNTDQTLWVKKDTASGNYEYFIVTQDGTMYKTTLEYINYVDQAAADEVEALITALPSAGKITLDDEDNIEAARVAYAALTPAQQALVADVAALVAAEAELDVLLTAELAGAVEAANTVLGKAAAALAAYIEAGGKIDDTDYIDVTDAQTALNNALAESPQVGYKILLKTAILTFQLDVIAMATDIELIEAGTYEIPLDNQTDQATKIAWVQEAVYALIENGSTVTVTWNAEESKYDVALALNKATGMANIIVII